MYIFMKDISAFIATFENDNASLSGAILGLELTMRRNVSKKTLFVCGDRQTPRVE